MSCTETNSIQFVVVIVAVVINNPFPKRVDITFR